MNEKFPTHIAFILDGNRRWAKEHGLPSLIGHERGFNRAKEIIKYSYDKGIKVVTMYCFSKENWSRTKKEVSYLMKLFYQIIASFIDELDEMNIRVVHLGDKSELPKRLADIIEVAEDKTKDNSRMIVQLAMNYSGWDELKRAMNTIVEEKLPVTVENIANCLDTKGQPDPDIIVRTSGEQRLSGFLLWQAAYAELYFTKVYWPDFTTEEFDKVIAEYQKRNRRFGGN